LKFEKRRPPKDQMLEKLSEDVERQGIKAFVQVLKVNDLQDLTAKMKKKKLTSNGANNKNSRSVMQKRLVETMMTTGTVKYLSALKLSEKTLKALFERVGIEPKESSKSDMVDLLATEIKYMGLSSIFSNCTVKQLQTYAKDLGLNIETSAKTVLLRCILAQKNYTSADKPIVVRKPKQPKKEAKESEDDDVDMYDPEMPRPAPPKFDWHVSEEDSDDDAEDFEPNADEDGDIEMSDVASENSEKQEGEKESGSDEDDGDEFKASSSDDDE